MIREQITYVRGRCSALGSQPSFVRHPGRPSGRQDAPESSSLQCNLKIQIAVFDRCQVIRCGSIYRKFMALSSNRFSS